MRKSSETKRDHDKVCEKQTGVTVTEYAKKQTSATAGAGM